MGTHIYERNDAKTRLAELMSRARQGERILIAENGEVVARLVPAKENAARRTNERRDRVEMPPEFEPADARIERMHGQGAVPRAFRTLPRR